MVLIEPAGQGTSTIMVLHIKKLCVGVSSVEQLREYIAQRQARGDEIYHTTRQFPRRAEQIIQNGPDNGSLYWVINKKIQARQRIVGFREGIRLDGGSGWDILLDSELILVSPIPHRPFQGWRYLEGDSCPPDVLSRDILTDLPGDLAFLVREFGVL